MVTQALIDRNLRDTATWWELLSQAPDGGAKTWAAPVAVKVRWEEGLSRVVPGTREVFTTQTRVFIDRVVSAGDRLFHGSSDSVDPESLDGTYPVVQFSKIPHLLVADVFMRVATL